MGGAGFPPCWLFGLRRLNTGAYRCSLVGLMVDSGRAHAKEYLPELVLPASLSLAEPHLPPASAGDPPTLAGGSGSASYGVTAPFPGSWCAHYFVCALQEWSLCFPQSCRSPAIKSNPANFQSLILQEFLHLLPGPQVGKPDVWLRTFTPVGRLLWYKCSPVCESPTQRLRDLILLWSRPSYRLIVASPLSLHVEYLFWWFPVSSCQWFFSS